MFQTTGGYGGDDSGYKNRKTVSCYYFSLAVLIYYRWIHFGDLIQSTTNLPNMGLGFFGNSRTAA